jgi:hypothetical protein
MPADTNQYGDIFGRWLLGQMDIAGGIFAAGIAKGRTATVAVDRNDVPQSRVRRRRHVARKRKESGRKVRGVNDLRAAAAYYTIKPLEQNFPGEVTEQKSEGREPQIQSWRGRYLVG